jgi:hypothetical protein
MYPNKMERSASEIEGEPPTEFHYGVDEKSIPGNMRLLTLDETFVVSGKKEGPFAVVRSPEGVAVADSPDRSLFGCRLTSGPAAPVGEARWKKDIGSKDVSKGRTYYEQFRPTSVSDRESKAIEIYWSVNKEMEFVSAGSGELVFSPHLEILCGVRGTNTSFLFGPESAKDTVAGVVKNLIVDVYYK